MLPVGVYIRFFFFFKADSHVLIYDFDRRVIIIVLECCEKFRINKKILKFIGKNFIPLSLIL